LNVLTSPAKMQILKGYIFRQSNPAVVGVEIQEGTLKSGTKLMLKDGKAITTVKAIQKEQESVSEAKRGEKLAVSLTDVIVGRHIKEGDVLYTVLTEKDYRKYKELKEHLSKDQAQALREIAAIKREDNPVWGI